jgi:hypothetical protein
MANSPFSPLAGTPPLAVYGSEAPPRPAQLHSGFPRFWLILHVDVTPAFLITAALFQPFYLPYRLRKIRILLSQQSKQTFLPYGSCHPPVRS